ncbi:MAG: hypothetical protein ABSF29_14105 [Tepidisphaeraceae bacterium]
MNRLDVLFLSIDNLLADRLVAGGSDADGDWHMPIAWPQDDIAGAGALSGQARDSVWNGTGRGYGGNPHCRNVREMDRSTRWNTGAANVKAMKLPKIAEEQ